MILRTAMLLSATVSMSGCGGLIIYDGSRNQSKDVIGRAMSDRNPELNSDDAAAWSDIGSSFTLGGAAEQTITAINGNTTAYRHLRFYLITGPSSNVPYLYEIEFKISAP